MAGLFDPYGRNSLAALLAKTETSRTMLGGVTPKAKSLLEALGGAQVTSAPRPMGSVYGAHTSMSPMLGSILAPIKRRTFFSFHYDDNMRVNNVRQAWKIDHPDKGLMRSFQDSSLWESKKLTDPEAIKKLIRAGVQYTSAVCVLIGSQTWSRRWVKYEIARLVIDKKGLLAVHLNNLNHHVTRGPHPLGYNPLHLMGIYKSKVGRYYLYERRLVTTNFLLGQREWQWLPYQDYLFPVDLPKYLAEPWIGYVVPLSAGTAEYDFKLESGHKNLGAWIDVAAKVVGR